MEVPAATSLMEIYPEDAVPSEKQRWELLLSEFEQKYEQPAGFVARSPGRVNIIGEHIDYSLYEVFPMAVTADVLLAVTVRPSTEPPRIRIANANKEKFPERNFEIPPEGEIPIDASSLEWSNYFKCGLRAASKLLQQKRDAGDSFVSIGMDVLVDGNVPAGAGLSSSAAFVCSSALAVMKANGEDKIDKKELTELAIVSERAVGVNSGGMDQSASVFALRGSALYVSFVPELSVRPVQIPRTDPEMTFVVAHSFVTSNKQESGPVCYNLRVVECTMAAALLAKVVRLKSPLPKDSSPLGTSLRGFHDTFFMENEGVADNSKTPVAEFEKQLEKLVQLTEDYLIQEEGYTREQLCDLLGMSIEQLHDRFLSSLLVRAEFFKLRQRALHVFGEAIRVIKFMSLLASAGPEESNKLLEELGGLMNQTQDSCRDIYECSCPELDELCFLARSAGACGSRLTGAGWGGCSVHLVPKDKVEAVKDSWINEYYKKRWPDITDERLKEAIVVSKPGSGSYIFKNVGVL